MKWNQILRHYSQFKNTRFENRYVAYSELEMYLKELPAYFQLKKEGHSVRNKAIYSLTLGTGKIKVLIWSQMHGDETTSTRALLDYLNLLQLNPNLREALFTDFTLKIIPVLNPDGAIAFSRDNANRIDLNRDALRLSQPESRLLKGMGENFRPDFCFNMHDQDAVYSIQNTSNSSLLSFLAPAFDEDRSLNTSRAKAMKIIAELAKDLQKEIPDHIGRYKDEFNPNCFGEYFQAQRIPTLLFESGHIERDYHREKTRKYVFYAFISALKIIQEQRWKESKTAAYFDIPLNIENYFDILIKNAMLEGELTDIGVAFNIKLKENRLIFLPEINAIGDLKNFLGHRVIHAEKQNLTGLPNKTVKVNEIYNDLFLNNEKIRINLTNN